MCEGELELPEAILLEKSLRVSDKPETYSIKKPSKEQVEGAVKLLLEGKVAQVALFYSKKNIMYHIYRDKKGKYYIIYTAEKKPKKQEISPEDIKIREILDKYGLPHEILLFK